MDSEEKVTKKAKRKSSSSLSEEFIKQREEQKQLRASLEEINRKKSRKSKSTIIMGFIMIIALTAMVVTLLLNFNDVKQISKVFGEIGQNNNWIWLIVAFVLLVTFLILWPMSLMAFSNASGISKVVRRRDIFRISTTEQYYNNITPFAIGGQPMEIYFLREAGAKTSDATGAVLASFLVHMIASNLYAVVALFFFPFYIDGLAKAPLFEWLTPGLFTAVVVIGYFNNLLTLVMTFLLGHSKKLRNLIVRLMTAISHWYGFRKWLPSKIGEFEAYCDNTQEAFQMLFHYKKAFARALLWRILADLAYYSIPFFILLAVGADFSGHNILWIYVLVTFATSFAITAVVWIPTPGTTGGIDYAFAVVIASLAVMGFRGELFAPSNLQATSQTISLIWRGFTYYFVILFGFLENLIFEISLAKRQYREIKALEVEANALQKENEKAPSLDESADENIVNP
ncbi:MAG: lysylphosphatidylglycerol synthase transmembrane domain-containing protein [Erysipelotrichaceae bacterium]|nr:lysylphosphatidylglycerol synthase transmembrane domain-containing protein [Erysipelotrichaceae bacterium]